MKYTFYVTLDFNETDKVTTLQKIQDRINEGPRHLGGVTRVVVSPGLRSEWGVATVPKR